MIGADIIFTSLENQGVHTVFGLPGGAVIPLYDRMKNFNINHILVKHEQGAVHAADGYARRSGEVGVCFATSGPGATNLMTGLVNAQMDSIPIVAITGQVARGLLGKDSFQEAFVTGITQPVCKYTIMVTDAEQLPQVLTDAFYIAKQGRPGPVVVDIPKDVFLQDVPEPDFSCKPRKRYAMKLKEGVITRDMVRKVVHLIEQSEKPLFILGGGANTTDENVKNLETLCKRWDIPATFTLMGSGLMSPESPYFLGMAGMHGTTASNYAIQHADLLIAVGMRFDDRVTSNLDNFAPHAKIIHVDIDTAEIGKNVQVDIPIVGNATDFLKQLVAFHCDDMNRDDWLTEVLKEKTKIAKPKDNHLSAVELFPYINTFIDDKTVVVTDVGQHQMWSALYLFPHGSRRFITSGGLGTMGFGFPAAIGAQFAALTDKVFLITGDGSFQMTMQELAVVKEFQTPLKILLMNNQRLGMVRQWQELFHDENYASTILDIAPEWSYLAKAYGIHYQQIRTLEEAQEHLPVLLTNDKPVFIDFRIDPMENVYPMVPGGKDLSQIVGEFENET